MQISRRTVATTTATLCLHVQQLEQCFRYPIYTHNLYVCLVLFFVHTLKTQYLCARMCNIIYHLCMYLSTTYHYIYYIPYVIYHLPFNSRVLVHYAYHVNCLSLHIVIIFSYYFAD